MTASYKKFKALCDSYGVTAHHVAGEVAPEMPYRVQVICGTPVRTVKVGGVLYACVEDIINA